MTISFLLLIVLALMAIGYQLGKQRSVSLAGGRQEISRLHSLPGYYGWLVTIWCGIPAIVVLSLWMAFETTVITEMVAAELPKAMRDLPEERLSLVINDVKNLAHGNIASTQVDDALRSAADHYRRLQQTSMAALSVVVIVLAMLGTALAWRRISPGLRARNQVEQVIKVFLIASSTIAVFTTLGIVLSVLFESIRFFHAIPIGEFLFGLEWSPQIAIRPDQVGSSGAFGAVPVFTGTLLISGLAMLVAVPVGLLSAIYLSEYATPRARATIKPLLEILAGIPTVVYGFFAALTVAPLIRDAGAWLGLDVASESALAAGLVMGIMIIPFVSSLSDDVINAVPQSMRDGSLALGATPSETIRRVLIPAALPGIVGAILLAVSRAIGETMIVVMAAGLSANLTANPLEAVTTVTVQIVTLLVGDQEFDSPKTLAAFALGLSLFVVTLVLNVVALHVVRKYREQYE
uniref:Phosphate transport system permease protein n=1 Tax=Candidatus Kentrum eta TaxID=2126337 RepID=A0A450V5X4_9GAMM|nr:MAG: phosphate ABC transporter membrane protein 1, PhoT family (TC 3.A.1.7.1) [Candidatus Kentron sp. H]VFJ93398.1 MAG: phosphate ABC transporter membrane protein 1, PhoT family (TC 3.A.1.7.1) [Candidatus Kentron sp. H]VFK00203.1 MAG: phosphate ABC transporter membrane protein 1, PhoT family (TC 3.A.1.7.1) [Candidatus Kentron sp. H]